MNKIYDFNELEEIRARQNILIFQYVIYLLGFMITIAIACIFIKSNILLASIFFILLLFFALFSIVFWKIKYGILKKRKSFLDDMESGKREDYVGVFDEMLTSSGDEEDFDIYIFIASNKKTNLVIHKLNRACFLKGKKYHIEHVGACIYQWEIVE